MPKKKKKKKDVTKHGSSMNIGSPRMTHERSSPARIMDRSANRKAEDTKSVDIYKKKGAQTDFKN